MAWLAFCIFNIDDQHVIAKPGTQRLSRLGMAALYTLAAGAMNKLGNNEN